MENPIVKFNLFGQEFEGGVKFEIIHDLPPKVFKSLFDTWYSLPVPFSEESLILYVKINHPDCVCLKKSDYDEITKGKVERVTKEEYENQFKSESK